MITQLIKEHVARLITQSEGFNSNQGQQYQDAQIREIIQEHARDLDELRHNIIYKKVKNVQLKVEGAGEKGKLDRMDDIHKEYVKTIRSTKDKGTLL